MSKRLLPILLLLSLSACTARVTPPTKQDVLAQAAKAVEAISVAANGAAKTVLQVMPDPSDDRTRILNIIGAVVQADQHAKNIVTALEAADTTTPAGVAKVLLPVFMEIRIAIDQGILGIKNPDSKRQATMWLDVVSITVTSIQGVLEVYGPADNPGTD